MCLITTQEKCKIANKDIICYKLVLEGKHKFVSVYFPFSWEPNKVYKQELNVEKTIYYQVFDTLVENHYLREYLNSYNKPELISVTNGFHAAKEKKRFNNDNWVGVMAEVIIPKGSEYYEDETGLIVSNQMKIIRILKD